MTKHRTREILDSCFTGLPKRDRDRLAHHYNAGTTILCGELAGLFYYKDGA